MTASEYIRNSWKLPKKRYKSLKIREFRSKELKVLKQLAYVGAGTSLSWTCAPFLVAVVTFASYVIVDPENNVLTVFPFFTFY
jgi:ATP-binding cassette subfamily C (CFTR/MRP) protein 1